TAACPWRLAQICSSEAVSAQIPSHRAHSRKVAPPITTAFMADWQRGQSCRVWAAASGRAAGEPQWEQNFSPTTIYPKQEGQATVARRAPQCSHRTASVEAAAPHI